MLRIARLMALGMLLTLGVSGCGAETPRKTEFPDNAFQQIPAAYFNRVENGGKVMSIQYETKNYTGGKEKYEKTALVYLPAGYDKEDKDTCYNVFYWMHGGGGDEKELLKGLMEDSDGKNLLDNMIANGDLEPCIVVTPSYNNQYNGDAGACCNYFWEELVNDLIPAVEGEYNTYCKSTSRSGIRASRLHRGFGGFSMGSACTWWVFENALKEVGYFLPVAGDSWSLGQGAGGYNPDGAAGHLAEVVADYGYNWEDFYIYCGVGSNDNMAGPNMKPMINSMKKEEFGDAFKWAENFRDGNCYFIEYQGGWHAYDTVYRVMYNGLPKFFG